MTIKLGSRFYESDEIMIKDAEMFIEKNKINLNTMHETGNEILFVDIFDTDNIIDFKDYSKLDKSMPKEKTPSLAKEKSAYRTGSKIKHPRFGEGIIKKTKKHGVDEDGNVLYNVTIDFNGREKTLRMKQK
jgi:hypothetical protein